MDAKNSAPFRKRLAMPTSTGVAPISRNTSGRTDLFRASIPALKYTVPLM